MQSELVYARFGGVPLIVIGTMRSWRSGGGRIALGGVIGMLICTVATMKSSTVHEYYQLPFLLFSSPLVGLGWQTWKYKQRRWLIQILLSITFIWWPAFHGALN